MKIFERICMTCKTRYGCKFFNHYGELVTWSCDTCLFHNCGGDCICRDKNEVELTHGICDSCWKQMRLNKEV